MTVEAAIGYGANSPAFAGHHQSTDSHSPLKGGTPQKMPASAQLIQLQTRPVAIATGQCPRVAICPINTPASHPGLRRPPRTPSWLIPRMPLRRRASQRSRVAATAHQAHRLRTLVWTARLTEKRARGPLSPAGGSLCDSPPWYVWRWTVGMWDEVESAGGAVTLCTDSVVTE